MHELSIAQSIIDVGARHAAGRRVRRVEVRIGHLRQVVPASLEFSFALLVPGSPLEGAELAIEHVSAVLRCRRCGERSEIEGFPLACAACGGLDVTLLSGEELLVDALELEEEMVLATTEGMAHGG